MGKANALIISGYGVNSQEETAHTCILAGFDRADTVHFADIAQDSAMLGDYGLIVFPGGFLDGDDLGAAQAAAVRWRYSKDAAGRPVLDPLTAFLDSGGLVLGICNGFQLLVKLGLLPALDGLRFTRQVSLGHNDSGRFEDRWVRLVADPASPCVFTRNLSSMYFPARHGEGKLVAPPDILEQLAAGHLIALRYADASGEPAQGYPDNPNGSPMAIAGLTDPSGHVLGLMPHPEAFHHVCNHPGWTRGEMDPPGTMLFVNALRYLREGARGNDTDRRATAPCS